MEKSTGNDGDLTSNCLSLDGLPQVAYKLQMELTNCNCNVQSRTHDAFL